MHLHTLLVAMKGMEKLAWSDVPLDVVANLARKATHAYNSAAMIGNDDPTHTEQNEYTNNLREMMQCACLALAKVAKSQPSAKKVFEAAQPAMATWLHHYAEGNRSLVDEVLSCTTMHATHVENYSQYATSSRRALEANKKRTKPVACAHTFLVQLSDLTASGDNFAAAAGMLSACAKIESFPLFDLWLLLSNDLTTVAASSGVSGINAMRALARLTREARDLGVYQPQEDDDGTGANHLRTLARNLIGIHANAVSSTSSSGRRACELSLECLRYMACMDLRLFIESSDSQADSILTEVVHAVVRSLDTLTHSQDVPSSNPPALRDEACEVICTLLRESGKLRAFPKTLEATLEAVCHVDGSNGGILALAQSFRIAKTIAELVEILPVGQCQALITSLARSFVIPRATAKEERCVKDVAKWRLIGLVVSEVLETLAASSENALRKGTGISLANLSDAQANSLQRLALETSEAVQHVLHAQEGGRDVHTDVVVRASKKRRVSKSQKDVLSTSAVQLLLCDTTAICLYTALHRFRGILATSVSGGMSTSQVDSSIAAFVDTRRIAPCVDILQVLQNTLTSTCRAYCAHVEALARGDQGKESQDPYTLALCDVHLTTSAASQCIASCTYVLNACQPAFARPDKLDAEISDKAGQIARAMFDVGASTLMMSSHAPVHDLASTWLQQLLDQPLMPVWLDLLGEERRRTLASIVLHTCASVEFAIKPAPGEDEKSCPITVHSKHRANTKSAVINARLFIDWLESADWEKEFVNVSVELLTIDDGSFADRECTNAKAIGDVCTEMQTKFDNSSGWQTNLEERMRCADRVLDVLQFLPSAYHIIGTNDANAHIERLAGAVFRTIRVTVLYATAMTARPSEEICGACRSVFVRCIDLLQRLSASSRLLHAEKVAARLLDFLEIAIPNFDSGIFLCDTISHDAFAASTVNLLISACASKKLFKQCAGCCVRLLRTLIGAQGNATATASTSVLVQSIFFSLKLSHENFGWKFRVPDKEIRDMADMLSAADDVHGVALVNRRLGKGVASAIFLSSIAFQKKSDSVAWPMRTMHSAIEEGLAQCDLLDMRSDADITRVRVMHRCIPNFIEIHGLSDASSRRIFLRLMRTNCDDALRCAALHAACCTDSCAEVLSQAFDDAHDEIRRLSATDAMNADDDVGAGTICTVQMVTAMVKTASPAERDMRWHPTESQIHGMLNALLDATCACAVRSDRLNTTEYLFEATLALVANHGRTKAITASHVASVLALPSLAHSVVVAAASPLRLFDASCSIVTQMIRTKHKACALAFHCIVHSCRHMCQALRYAFDRNAANGVPDLDALQSLDRMSMSLGRMFEVIAVASKSHNDGSASTKKDAAQWPFNLSLLVVDLVHDVLTPVDLAGAHERAGALILRNLKEGTYALIDGCDYDSAYLSLGRRDGGTNRSTLARWRSMCDQEYAFRG